jgi:hypothetical protein
VIGPPALGYFDTSAVMRWLEAAAVPPRPINTRIAAAVDAFLASSTRLAISELTLVEARANITKDWRIADPQNASYDNVWAKSARSRLMTLIRDRRIELIPSPAHAIEQAMSLVDLAASEYALPVGIWDTVHLLTACAWANRENGRVALITSDPDYDAFVARYPFFLEFVDVANLDAMTTP